MRGKSPFSMWWYLTKDKKKEMPKLLMAFRYCYYFYYLFDLKRRWHFPISRFNQYEFLCLIWHQCLRTFLPFNCRWMDADAAGCCCISGSVCIPSVNICLWGYSLLRRTPGLPCPSLVGAQTWTRVSTDWQTNGGKEQKKMFCVLSREQSTACIPHTGRTAAPQIRKTFSSSPTQKLA